MTILTAAVIAGFAVSAPRAKAATGSLTQVNDFGSNPGNLKMYKYVPNNLDTSNPHPLVVCLHGGAQGAQDIGDSTGYNELAKRRGFYMVYPEQRIGNNLCSCFNWFLLGDQEREHEEPLLIKQMVDYMKSNYNVDSDRVYVSGFSAGGYMVPVMLATYPDVFDGGVIMSGGPYKAARNVIEAFRVMWRCPDMPPSYWGALVRSAYWSYSGDYPEVSI